MSASEDLDKTTINRLRTDMTRTNAAEYRELMVLREQLVRWLNQRRYDHSPKTRVQG